MRIGELLNTRMVDVRIKERKIEIYEGEKNRLGRVVYLSDDAILALRKWLKKRNPGEAYLFYGKNVETMSYSTARLIFPAIFRKGWINGPGLFPALAAPHLCHGVAQRWYASGVSPGFVRSPEYRGDQALRPADR